MKIENYHDLAQHFKPGDFIWATAFSYTSTKEAMHTKQEPILGMLAAGKTPNSHAVAIARNPRANITYFIPCSKTGTKRLCWSRCVKAYSRSYATTEVEATEMYNQQIKNAIDWHQWAIKTLEAAKLPVPNNQQPANFTPESGL